MRVNDPRRRKTAIATSARASSAVFDLDQIVNYVTPGYATAVFVSAQGVERIRTTAESHRRIAIIEVMGRHSGYIALGTAYGQPDIILVPEHPLDIDTARRAGQASLRSAEERRDRLRRRHRRRAGPRARRRIEVRPIRPETSLLSGAAEALRAKMIQMLGDRYFQLYRRGEIGAAKRSSPEKSATRSAAAGRSCSIASTRRCSAPRRSICWSKAATTPCPFFNTTPTRAFTSKATTPTASAIAGA